MRQRWGKIMDKLLVGSKVDEGQIQNKLNDLETRHPFFPPDANTAGSEEIVPVHDHMDKEVKCDWDPRDRGQADQLCVAQKCRSTVVSVFVNHWNQLLGHQSHERQGQNSEKQIMELKQSVENQRSEVVGFQNMLTTKDDNVIENDGTKDRHRRREKSLSCDKIKFARNKTAASEL
ncbi:hypothetical protein OGATHE_002475 [Ogataea polymorpha]|uniref:Uncharacterized protein n=1 Tax=Ogataea polymorpha TaxID=460523 RepID=A0A9P8T7X4_9ASCO|nr:hypothetical protein OGATHE_002475 [Ogataea polymorpha]